MPETVTRDPESNVCEAVLKRKLNSALKFIEDADNEGWTERERHIAAATATRKVREALSELEHCRGNCQNA